MDTSVWKCRYIEVDTSVGLYKWIQAYIQVLYSIQVYTQVQIQVYIKVDTSAYKECKAIYRCTKVFSDVS